MLHPSAWGAALTADTLSTRRCWGGRRGRSEGRQAEQRAILGAGQPIIKAAPLNDELSHTSRPEQVKQECPNKNLCGACPELG